MINICTICRKAVSDKCKSIFCVCCKSFIHQQKCSNLSRSDILYLSQNNNGGWFCSNCITENLPFCGTYSLASMPKHFDELNTLLVSLQHKFSVIGISETRFVKDRPTSFNFNITGYSAIHTTTESSAGGALLYISDRFSYFPRTDLDQCMYLSNQLESVFAEITLPKKSNIIVGCIYRHPNMSITEFNTLYLTPLFYIIGKENKKIFLMGDFNINLLKSNESNDVSSFLDCLGSHLILPRVREEQPGLPIAPKP